MKYSVVWSFLVLLACGCSRNRAITKLLSEQKLLKDSTNHINERIGDYINKGLNDSVEAQKKQLGAVYARLTAIQFSLDSLSNKR